MKLKKRISVWLGKLPPANKCHLFAEPSTASQPTAQLIPKKVSVPPPFTDLGSFIPLHAARRASPFVSTLRIDAFHGKKNQSWEQASKPS